MNTTSNKMNTHKYVYIRCITDDNEDILYQIKKSKIENVTINDIKSDDPSIDIVIRNDDDIELEYIKELYINNIKVTIKTFNHELTKILNGCN